ncbi:MULTISPECIES: HNH endonuclease signature motif containing protein [unclassified Polaromonas]|jgi:hypothetical protein|uniref:HNH endonuclease signature motif containing protein n=1 Tax=unclassified Polaromonas TaxID=2638319 RepID=UPI000BDC1021|nr:MULTISPECIES: HNH endonuclease signature motif containing protein [unclassified Polaromonas]OYY34747.1 MAG: hypothetical protein B7Y60_15000 [Polaromonas sp. 35-63-35]OYZ19368.1 MAG: hypothetical protein B7Y28_12590 [Polaromonas sp. 16-63-31]OYZ77507.1 MAG: hypothetical protein B7Y09_16150 [Polaromonas sp. 24-63-21]OZA48509.1 MAG: hypothetical protein B7X88_18360 [Polaromonas sp. 17-63-33]OZA87259.1 MAG: hypothetical protein B7X65_13840 [Polaromonas sp. 39-63-25]
MNCCSVDGCETTGKLRKSLCQKHYTRYLRYGDPLRERPNTAERFSAKYCVDEASGCWLWTGAISRRGYGVFQLGVGTQGKAHRVSWELANGPIPDGLGVLHRCDTPGCVNPSHLFLGTNSDNMADMVQKKRSLARTKNPNCKLSESDVALVLSSNEVAPVLARSFGVNPATVRRIRRNENWKRAVPA